MKNSAYMTRILMTVWVVFVAYGALTLVGGCSDDGYKYRFSLTLFSTSKPCLSDLTHLIVQLSLARFAIDG